MPSNYFAEGGKFHYMKGYSKLAIILSTDILAGVNDAPESHLGNRAHVNFVMLSCGHMEVNGDHNVLSQGLCFSCPVNNPSIRYTTV